MGVCRKIAQANPTIREQLDRILSSGPFLQSRRRQRFLEYIVNETLAGRGERLKGYNVALAVFDRPKTFDPAIDPIVRIEAARLREKLREYYETDGQTDPIRIELRKGSYAPQIEFRKPAEDQHQDPVAEPAAPRDKTPAAELSWWKRGQRWRIAVSALAAMVVLAGAWLTRDLWAPAPKRAPTDAVLDVPKGPAIAVLPFVNLRAIRSRIILATA
jgi:hypothetical protein